MNTLFGGIIILAFIILPIYYCYLGIDAIKYLNHSDQVDKVVGWALWCCLELSRYSKKGKKNCIKGQLVIITIIIMYFIMFYLPNK